MIRKSAHCLKITQNVTFEFRHFPLLGSRRERSSFWACCKASSLRLFSSLFCSNSSFIISNSRHWISSLMACFRSFFALKSIATRWISSRLPALFGSGSRWRALNWPSRVAVRSPFSDQNWELLEQNWTLPISFKTCRSSFLKPLTRSRRSEISAKYFKYNIGTQNYFTSKSE